MPSGFVPSLARPAYGSSRLRSPVLQRSKNLGGSGNSNPLPKHASQSLSYSPEPSTPAHSISKPGQCPAAKSIVSQPILDVPIDDPAPICAAHTAVVFTPDALRIGDHAALQAAASAGHQHVVCVLVSNPAAMSVLGGHCAWSAAAEDFRRSLRSLGSDLVVLDGSAGPDTDACVARAVLDFCHEIRAGVLYAHNGGFRQHSSLQFACEDSGVEYVSLWSGTLLSPAQLPFALSEMSANCDAFASALDFVPVEEPLPSPESLPSLPASALSHVTDIPFCPSSSPHDQTPKSLPLDYLCETDVLKFSTSFFSLASDGSGVASFLKTDSFPGERSAGGRLCKCMHLTRPSRPIDTVLGRLANSLYRGVISPRQLHHIMTESELSENSPRSYCAKLELLHFEFAAYDALRKGNRKRGHRRRVSAVSTSKSSPPG